jgi:hypothetical protein
MIARRGTKVRLSKTNSNLALSHIRTKRNQRIVAVAQQCLYFHTGYLFRCSHGCNIRLTTTHAFELLRLESTVQTERAWSVSLHWIFATKEATQATRAACRRRYRSQCKLISNGVDSTLNQLRFDLSY